MLTGRGGILAARRATHGVSPTKGGRVLSLQCDADGRAKVAEEASEARSDVCGGRRAAMPAAHI